MNSSIRLASVCVIIVFALNAYAQGPCLTASKFGPTRTFAITIVQPGQNAGTTLGPTKTTYNDDMIVGWAGVGSQLDGLGPKRTIQLKQEPQSQAKFN